LSLPPLALAFEFNPESLSRNRSITISLGDTPATRGGYDFALPSETPRVAQSVSVEPESFNVDILLDATDRQAKGDPIATEHGIEPELDTLRSMVEPKTQGPGGFQMLSNLGLGGARAFQQTETASVILFVWGAHVLPVFLKGIDVQETAHLPTLVPYRATVKLSMQVIEGNNPFYKAEKLRQIAGAALNTADVSLGILGGML
jgi:hypothetical protein